MILRHTVIIQQRTGTTGTEGERTYTFSTFKNISADVQPISLNAAELAMWGLTDLSANSKKMFFRKNDLIVPSMRVIFGSDAYEIRGINSWSIHSVALLVPVQGL